MKQQKKSKKPVKKVNDSILLRVNQYKEQEVNDCLGSYFSLYGSFKGKCKLLSTKHKQLKTKIRAMKQLFHRGKGPKPAKNLLKNAIFACKCLNSPVIIQLLLERMLQKNKSVCVFVLKYLQTKLSALKYPEIQSEDQSKQDLSAKLLNFSRNSPKNALFTAILQYLKHLVCSNLEPNWYKEIGILREIDSILSRNGESAFNISKKSIL